MSTPTLAELQLPHDVTIRDVQVVDVRFPTSLFRIGSDAVNTDPDYSAAYITLVTDTEEQGYGLTFTLGRGTEVCVLAIQFLAGFVRGRKLSAIVGDFGVFVRELVRDTQFRWLGPEKGVVHLAAAALINAVWDLYARVAGKPVWQLLAEMPSEHLVRLIDFSYITDALTPAEAYEILQAGQVGLSERLAELKRTGVPAYTTSPGWIGLTDDEVRTLCTQAAAQGFRHVKMKVGGAHEEDMRRAALIRSTLPQHMRLMMDANQRWDVGEAIERTRALSVFDPWWMEEPTSPDDILGHAAIRRETGVRIATGEHCQNRVIFKQLLQAGATDVVQIDSCRLAGVNENVTVLLLAAKFGVPVCAHAGGVGLCEYVQHLAAFDYLRVACTFENRVTEFVDHLHEHFTEPVQMVNGHYRLPNAPGYSAKMWDTSIAEFQFPYGRAWAGSGSV